MRAGAIVLAASIDGEGGPEAALGAVVCRVQRLSAGTLNVYRRSDDTTVSVLEGRVQVTPERQGSPAIAQTPAGQGASPPPALSAGEQVRIGVDERIEQRTAPIITPALSTRTIPGRWRNCCRGRRI